MLDRLLGMNGDAAVDRHQAARHIGAELCVVANAFRLRIAIGIYRAECSSLPRLVAFRDWLRDEVRALP